VCKITKIAFVEYLSTQVHTQTGSNSSTIAVDSSNGLKIPDAVDTVVCAPEYGWKYHPKHVELFPDISKLCNFASCWIYEYTGILLGVQSILHISRIRVNRMNVEGACNKLSSMRSSAQ
jgi:hypothetical protein